ncbi:hypothetical protein E6W39_31335 [Kitasatospora acidiphila]|uniref:DUF6879 domain-containing protein n=1 Tax=Kitasatospora acidiphila TaxID=2567942 RepID=A0A540WA40_9ACTN|nr:DUF6879 family protein [Kitasatospora acidiphila]TQF05901.1 hypothetical protein E6W39_31335 [Kitasatospora acidiphila]
MLLDGDEWQSYLRDFKHSAFRLEAHQIYTMPFEAETLASFLSGDPLPEGFNADWHDRIRDHRAKGRVMTRAKLVRLPLTDYSRYLFEWCIPGNVAAGEDYRIVDLTRRSLDLPEQDFWMFDESVVVHMNYRPDGTQINRTLIENPDIPKYLRWRDLALAESVSFAEWNSARS